MILSPTGIETKLPKIFDQAQSSIANHQKNCVALYKVHLTVSELRQSSSSGNAEKLVGERFFEDTICDMMSHVMLVKKGQGVTDRIARTLGTYLEVLVDVTFRAFPWAFLFRSLSRWVLSITMPSASDLLELRHTVLELLETSDRFEGCNGTDCPFYVVIPELFVPMM